MRETLFGEKAFLIEFFDKLILCKNKDFGWKKFVGEKDCWGKLFFGDKSILLNNSIGIFCEQLPWTKKMITNFFVLKKCFNEEKKLWFFLCEYLIWNLLRLLLFFCVGKKKLFLWIILIKNFFFVLKKKNLWKNILC